MKKIFILLLVAGCSFSLFAQENDSSANTREELLVGVKITPPFIMENEDGSLTITTKEGIFRMDEPTGEQIAIAERWAKREP